MKPPLMRICPCWLIFALVATSAGLSWPAEPKVHILTPQNGARISHDQNTILLSGKVAGNTGRSAYVDIFFLIDVSLSTAHYAGVDFPDLVDLPGVYISPGRPRPRITVLGGGINSGPTGEAPRFNLRNSIFAAEIVASRRMLSHLDPQTTRAA